MCATDDCDSCSNCSTTPDGLSAVADWDSCGSYSIFGRNSGGLHAATDWDSCSNCSITPDGLSTVAYWDRYGNCSIFGRNGGWMHAAADWDSLRYGGCSITYGGPCVGADRGSCSCGNCFNRLRTDGFFKD